MHIVFRADSSQQIGTGHVMRCLALADALRERGVGCTFICRPHAGHLLDLIARRGHKAVALPTLEAIEVTAALPPSEASAAHLAWLGTDWATDAWQTKKLLSNQAVDWLVVDHYALDHKWERELQPYCTKLMVIDDLADRPHECDLLLDQNLGRKRADYDGLVKAGTTALIGPAWALLRSEFSQLRPYSLARRANPQLSRLLITMGGVDKDNATGKVLSALQNCQLPTGMKITIVMGPHAPWLQQVKAQAERVQVPTQVLVDVDNMAQLMADSDLAIGAAGGTSWERCCLGLPTALLVLAPNQYAGAQALLHHGAATILDNAEELQRFFNGIHFAALLSSELRKMSAACAALTDGNGAIEVAAILKGLA